MATRAVRSGTTFARSAGPRSAPLSSVSSFKGRRVVCVVLSAIDFSNLPIIHALYQVERHSPDLQLLDWDVLRSP